MADEGVDIRIRTTGGPAASRDVDRVSRSIGGLAPHARRSRDELRFYDRAIVNTSGHLRLLGGAALYGGAALAGILLIGLKKTADAWEEQRKVTAQTGAVLRSTGGAAHISARGIEEQANALERKTAIDHASIQAGENLLLTFRSIRNETGAGNDIFNQATVAVLDMSVALKQDAKASAIQLGKALNDPITGLTALRRVGVSFTEQQKAQIKTMTESGNLLGAQKIILAELTKEFGGSAAAAATPLARLKIGVKNVEEAIGHGLSPVVDAAAGGLTHLADEAAPSFEKLGNDLNRIFARKDLSLADKLSLAGADVHRTLSPLEHELHREIAGLHLGDDLNKALEFALPKLANTLAAAAPKAGVAFVKAWWHADIWGKLLTLGLLERKFGIFGAVGQFSARRFGTGFGRGLSPAVVGQQGRIGGAGRLAGGFFEPAMAAIIIAELPNIWEQIGNTLGLGPDFQHEAKRGFRDLNPFDAESASSGAELNFERMRRLGAHRERVPGTNRSVWVQDGMHLEAAHTRGGYRAVRDTPGHAAPGVLPPAGGRTTTVHLHVDGKHFATAVVRNPEARKVVTKAVNHDNATARARG